MLWGRRSERRLEVSMTPLLNFGDDLGSDSKASSEVLGPEIIAAQAAVQAAYELCAVSIGALRPSRD